MLDIGHPFHFHNSNFKALNFKLVPVAHLQNGRRNEFPITQYSYYAAAFILTTFNSFSL